LNVCRVPASPKRPLSYACCSFGVLALPAPPSRESPNSPGVDACGAWAFSRFLPSCKTRSCRARALLRPFPEGGGRAAVLPACGLCTSPGGRDGAKTLPLTVFCTKFSFVGQVVGAHPPSGTFVRRGAKLSGSPARRARCNGRNSDSWASSSATVSSLCLFLKQAVLTLARIPRAESIKLFNIFPFQGSCYPSTGTRDRALQKQTAHMNMKG